MTDKEFERYAKTKSLDAVEKDWSKVYMIVGDLTSVVERLDSNGPIPLRCLHADARNTTCVACKAYRSAEKARDALLDLVQARTQSTIVTPTR